MTVKELTAVLKSVPDQDLPVYLQINNDVCMVERATKEPTQETMWTIGREQRDMEMALVLG
jgi:hypothetical protein